MNTQNYQVIDSNTQEIYNSFATIQEAEQWRLTQIENCIENLEEQACTCYHYGFECNCKNCSTCKELKINAIHDSFEINDLTEGEAYA